MKRLYSLILCGLMVFCGCDSDESEETANGMGSRPTAAPISEQEIPGNYERPSPTDNSQDVIPEDPYQPPETSEGPEEAPSSDLPMLTINDPSVVEGDFGDSFLVFTVSLSPQSVDAVSLDWDIQPGGTALPNEDYSSSPGWGTLEFNPGTIIQSISITIHGDTDVENNETIVMGLFSPVNAEFGDDSGIGTILNDD